MGHWITRQVFSKGISHRRGVKVDIVTLEFINACTNISALGLTYPIYIFCVISILKFSNSS